MLLSWFSHSYIQPRGPVQPSERSVDTEEFTDKTQKFIDWPEHTHIADCYVMSPLWTERDALFCQPDLLLPRQSEAPVPASPKNQGCALLLTNRHSLLCSPQTKLSSQLNKNLRMVFPGQVQSRRLRATPKHSFTSSSTFWICTHNDGNTTGAKLKPRQLGLPRTTNLFKPSKLTILCNDWNHMKNNILCLVSIPGWQQGLTFSPVSGCEEPGLAVLPQVFNQPGKNTVRLPVLFSSPYSPR